MATAAFALQILEPSDFAAIRAWIDISISSDNLPDSIIEQYGPFAESEVLARDANALTYQAGVTQDDVKWVRVRRAAILLTAARLCGALPAITSEQVGADRYARAAFDAEKREAYLRGLANQEISAYLEPNGLTEVLFSFGVARGYRGR